MRRIVKLNGGNESLGKVAPGLLEGRVDASIGACPLRRRGLRAATVIDADHSVLDAHDTALENRGFSEHSRLKNPSLGMGERVQEPIFSDLDEREFERQSRLVLEELADPLRAFGDSIADDHQ